jgi:hypothetical protein
MVIHGADGDGWKEEGSSNVRIFAFCLQEISVLVDQYESTLIEVRPAQPAWHAIYR